MNIERLKLMSDMLGEVVAGTWEPSVQLPKMTPAGFFHLGCWVHTGSCGFSACAVGHALLDSRFTVQGLVAADGLLTGVRDYVPRYEDYDQWHAVDEFFDIGFPISRPLFSMEYYPQGSEDRADLVKARVDFLIGLTTENPEWGHGGKSFYERLREAGL